MSNNDALQFSGALSLNEKSFRVECDTHDEIFFEIRFVEPYGLSKAEKEEVGSAAFSKAIEIFQRRQQ